MLIRTTGISALLLPALLTSVLGTNALARDLTATGGAFYFNATDYYYPNFYDEAGFRAEFDYKAWANPSSLRLQFYGYPGDDNGFETIVEYDYGFRLHAGGFAFGLTPTAGLGVLKLQYPAPYYPEVTHQFLPWLRLGGEAGVGRHVLGPISLRGAYRLRLLYYFGSSYGAFDAESGGDPWELVHMPYGEVAVKLSESWTALGRGGVEAGGWYDTVFITPDKKLRPFGEVGFTHAF